MDDLLFIIPLAIVIAALLAPRRARTAPPGGQQPAAHPASMVSSRPPFFALLGMLVARDLARVGHALRDFGRGFVTSFQLQQAPPRRLTDNAMSSTGDEVSPSVTLDLANAVLRSPDPVPGPAQIQVGPGDDEPDYIIRPSRAQALEMLFTRGGTARDLELLQEGDTATIRRVMAMQIPRRVIAQIAGGQKARRMDESAAALSEGVGDGMA